MLDNLTYKQKYRLLLGGLFLFSFIIINNTLTKTYTAYTQNKELKNELKKAQDAPAQIGKLKAQLTEADLIFQGQKDTAAINVHEKILGIVSQYCHENKVTLMSFPEPHLSKDGEFITETNIITLQSSFKKMLELVYLLEQKERPGKITSLHFKTLKNFETRQTELTSTIYLQTFKKTEP